MSYTKTDVFVENGYTNLIKNVPYTSIYSPNSEVTNCCYMQSSLIYKASDKTILETLVFSYEQKLKAVNNQNKIKNDICWYSVKKILFDAKNISRIFPSQKRSVIMLRQMLFKPKD